MWNRLGDKLGLWRKNVTSKYKIEVKIFFIDNINGQEAGYHPLDIKNCEVSNSGTKLLD